MSSIFIYYLLLLHFESEPLSNPTSLSSPHPFSFSPDNTHCTSPTSHYPPESLIPINMLIVDRQRPKSLGEMDFHKDISQNLIKMVHSLPLPHLL